MHVPKYTKENGAEIMRLLINAGADVHKQDNYRGWPALMYVVEDGKENVVEMMRLLVASGSRIPPVHMLRRNTQPEIISYIKGAQNWTPLHRAADARDADAIIKCLSEGMRPDAVVESSHQDMRTALSIAESTSYPTAQPVCDDCLALFRPSLVKGGAPSDSLFGGGGGGGGGAQTES
tara:strand:- start:43 stop:576 length:534 start_codon:yes stop_codon:yes gene_type:complete